MGKRDSGSGLVAVWPGTVVCPASRCGAVPVLQHSGQVPDPGSALRSNHAVLGQVAPKGVEGFFHGLLGSALDLGAEGGQTFVDSFVSAPYLVGVADQALPSGAERRDQHRHSGANVGTLHPAPP